MILDLGLTEGAADGSLEIKDLAPFFAAIYPAKRCAGRLIPAAAAVLIRFIHSALLLWIDSHLTLHSSLFTLHSFFYFDHCVQVTARSNRNPASQICIKKSGPQAKAPVRHRFGVSISSNFPSRPPVRFCPAAVLFHLTAARRMPWPPRDPVAFLTQSHAHFVLTAFRSLLPAPERPEYQTITQM
jgi:hypothetical protein